MVEAKGAGNRMKRRIGLWALSGFAVACGWVIYGMATAPSHNLGRWTIVAITAPASLIGRAIPLAYYWVIFFNAAAYALFGLATEPLRRAIARRSSN